MNIRILQNVIFGIQASIRMLSGQCQYEAKLMPQHDSCIYIFELQGQRIERWVVAVVLATQTLLGGSGLISSRRKSALALISMTR